MVKSLGSPSFFFFFSLSVISIIHICIITILCSFSASGRPGQGWFSGLDLLFGDLRWSGQILRHSNLVSCVPNPSYSSRARVAQTVRIPTQEWEPKLSVFYLHLQVFAGISIKAGIFTFSLSLLLQVLHACLFGDIYVLEYPWYDIF